MAPSHYRSRTQQTCSARIQPVHYGGGRLSGPTSTFTTATLSHPFPAKSAFTLATTPLLNQTLVARFTAGVSVHLQLPGTARHSPTVPFIRPRSFHFVRTKS